MSDTPVVEPVAGWLAREVEEELPGLRLFSVEARVQRVQRLSGDSPADVEARMRSLSSRIRGGRAISIRREPVPAAYRIFFRHIGLDPDVERTPIEAAVLERMLRGGFPTGGLLEDVLLIALLDTGVPVWALDAERVDGPLGIRTSIQGETLGRDGDATPLPGGRLVVADAAGTLAILFGAPAAAHAPGPRARRLLLFAVQVAGVPMLYVDEALWSVRSALEHP
jgi:DNA/RNA-binding domain of Phe-tRNA-synthetase-like protein